MLSPSRLLTRLQRRRRRSDSKMHRKPLIERLELRQMLAADSSEVRPNGSYAPGHVFTITNPAALSGVINVPANATSYTFDFNATVRNPIFGAFPAGTHLVASLRAVKENSGATTTQDFAGNLSPDSMTMSFPGQIVVPPGFTHTTFRAQRTGNVPQSVVILDAFIDTVVNRIPNAPSPVFVVQEDTLLAGQINATDADGNPLTFSIITPPTRGSIVSGINGSGNFTYQPDSNEFGVDSFTYRVTDGFASVDRAVTINVLPVADAPVFSAPLSKSVAQNSSITINAFENASDPDGDALDANSVQITLAPTQGQVNVTVVGGQAQIEYTADPTSTGVDQFEYTIEDVTGLQSLPQHVDIGLVARPEIVGLVDNVLPGTGTFSFPAFTNDTTPRLIGTSDPSATISIVGLSGPPLTTVADGSGNWSIDLGLLASGQTYAVRADATKLGVTATGQNVNFTIDTLSPGISATGAPSSLLKESFSGAVSFAFADSSGLADPVTGFELSDLSLRKGSSTDNRLSGAGGVTLQALVPSVPSIAGFTDRYQLNGLNTVTNETGTYELVLDNAASGIVDRASNPLSNSFLTRFAIDATAPQVLLRRLTTTALLSQLPIEVVDAGSTTTANVNYLVRLSDQQFAGFTSSVTVSLVEVTGSQTTVLKTTTVNIPAGAADALNFALPDVNISADLPAGLHTLKLLVTDQAGNALRTNGSDGTAAFNVFIQSVGAATVEAPGTPSFSEKWFIGATVQSASGNQIVVNQPIPTGTFISVRVVPADPTQSASIRKLQVLESSAQPGGLTRLTLESFSGTIAAGTRIMWLRPWTNSFDKATQTTWLTMEDGVSVAQFDPATGAVKLFNVGQAGTPLGPVTSGDPHGVSFDFNGHLTPRVWFVYRNSNLDQDAPEFTTPAGIEFPSAVGYLDVVTNTLRTVLLNDVQLTSSANPSQQRTADITGTHAVFTDTRGHVWITAEHMQPPAILEVDLSRSPSGARNSLDSTSGTIIVHNIPAGLGNGIFAPHGLTVEVDEVTGTPYVFLSDGPEGIQPSTTGRLVLLRPGANGGADIWTEWNIDAAVAAEGRAGGTALFLTIDNNETPGDPRDDRLIATDPGTLARTGPAGIVRVFDLASVLGPMVEQDRLRFAGIPFSTPTLPATASVTSYELPVVPGVAAAKPSPQVPFVDRLGEIFYVDATGGFGRFGIDGDNSAFRVSRIDAPLTNYSSFSELGAIAFSNAVQVPTLEFNAQPVVTATSLDDRSSVPGVDVYEVAQPSTAGFGGAGQRGLFRGALNAENTLYGSLANSDHVSASMVAESNRRRIAVVPSPFTPPTGSQLVGRAALQVLRDGSVVLTGRGDGELLDGQVNLTKQLLSNGQLSSFDAGAVIGDVAAIHAPGGGIELLGRRANGQLVRYRFQPPQASWKTSDLINARNWAVTQVAMPAGQIAAEDPAAAPGVGFTVTTAAGRLIVVRQGGTAVDLSGAAGQRVFAGVGGVVLGNQLKFYGTNQTGKVVEYTANAALTVVTSKLLNVPNTPAVRPGGDSDRDIRMLRNIRPLLDGDTIHLFGGDGVSRLVHYELDRDGNVTRAENVTRATVSSNAYGYFSFERPYAGRVYTYVSVVRETDGSLRVYGTNGGELIEFTRDPAGQWRVGNLTNDIRSTNPITPATPGSRIPANAVFGAPAAYITAGGDRHILQINANGEVVEYYTMPGDSSGRIHTQNVNLRRGSAGQITDLRFRTNAPAGAVTASSPLVGAAEGSPSIATGNPARFDINGDGRVTPLDALLVINELNRISRGTVSTASSHGDTDGNGLLTALDALLVINYLNQQPAGEGEATPWADGELVADLSDLGRVKKQVTDGIFEDWE